MYKSLIIAFLFLGIKVNDQTLNKLLLDLPDKPTATASTSKKDIPFLDLTKVRNNLRESSNQVDQNGIRNLKKITPYQVAKTNIQDVFIASNPKKSERSLIALTKNNFSRTDTSKSKQNSHLRRLPISENGKLLSIDGYEVDFKEPKDSLGICFTPSPYITTAFKDAGCPYVVPCDNPSNRDAANETTLDYFQLEWHVILNGGVGTNINQLTVDALMTELNADFAAANMVFCADPANFIEDPMQYDHNEFTEESSLKIAYSENPSKVINVYVVGNMGAGGYARLPYDPNGGTSTTGGIVLNRSNSIVGVHTLAHEMGHVMGLLHTFAGVDERSTCSSCYEKVRNVNGSSNTTGVPTPLGGPYADEGDREGDWCSDTNPHDTYSFNCSTSANPTNICDSNPWANAPVDNHMSYSFCSSQFTPQQIRRMHCMADSYLDSWIEYGGVACGDLPPKADFIASPTRWSAPVNVNFTDLSPLDEIITNWTWIFDVGASNSVSCAGCTGTNATFVGQNPPVVNYPNPGLYTVQLNITSPNGNDTETKVDYIEVLAPAGDCDTLTTQWETPPPTVITYGFGGGWISGVPDPVNMVLPTDPKGIYEGYFTPNPGVTPIGGVRVGLGSLRDDDDDMKFQVVVYDDDGAGAPGAVVGGVGNLSPTQLGVPGPGFFNEIWIPFPIAPIPTTGFFHVGVEIFSGGDATDTLVVMTSCLGPSGCPVAQGEADASNHIFTTGFGYENLLTVYGADFDVDIIPMLGEWKPMPILEGYTERVECDTTFVTIFDTVRYSIPVGWTFSFADGTIINATSDPGSIDRVYTKPGPDTVKVLTVNACGRVDSATWIIPYNFLPAPEAEFSKLPTEPICTGTPGIDFSALPGYKDYTWDFGDGTSISTAGVNNVNHIYTTPGTYNVELRTSVDGFEPSDTFYLEDFENGWPSGYDRYNNDAFTPDPGVNPPFTGTNATAWLVLDSDADENFEAVSTSWNGASGQLADDWMLTIGLGPLPANQRLYWDAKASDVNFPDGYEVRLSTSQLPANSANYTTLLYNIEEENPYYTTRSIDLSLYVGQTVFIAFRNNSDFDNLLFIDNIRVGTATPGCFAIQQKTAFVEVVDCAVIPPVAMFTSMPTDECQTLSITFTDATVAGDPATSWLWNFGDGSFSTLQDPPAHVYDESGSYFVSLKVCNAGGCTTDSKTVSVEMPAPQPFITGRDTSICDGAQVDLISLIDGTTVNTLEYKEEGGTYSTNAMVMPTMDPTTYIVRDSSAITGCSDTAKIVINVNPQPLITGRDTSICEGAVVDLISLIDGTTVNTLEYKEEGGIYSTNAMVMPTIDPTTYIVRDSSAITGCSDTAKIVINVNPQPLITGRDTSICEGAVVDLISLIDGTTVNTLEYKEEGGIYSTNAMVMPTIDPTTYIVRDSSAITGCSDTAKIVINVNPQPLITGRDTSICEGAVVDLISLIEGTTVNTLEYKEEGGIYSTNAMVMPTMDPTTYIVRDSSAITGCSDTAKIVINVNPQPLITGRDSSICEGAVVDLISLIDGTTVNTLEYKEEGGTYSTNAMVMPTMDPMTYIVRDSSAITGCSDTAKIVINVNPQPLITGRDTTVCMGAIVDLSKLISGSLVDELEYGTTYGTYGESPTIQAIGSATYFVRDSSDETGCVDTAEINVNVLNSMACLMKFSSNNIIFGDPCDCDQVVKNEDLLYFRDTLVVTTESPVSNVNFYATGSTDFYKTPGIEMPDDELFIQVSPTMYKLEFFKLSNVQAVGFVTANNSEVAIMITEDALQLCFVNVDCPAMIPTIGQWGVIVLLMIMLIVGLVFVRQKKLQY